MGPEGEKEKIICSWSFPTGKEKLASLSVWSVGVWFKKTIQDGTARDKAEGRGDVVQPLRCLTEWFKTIIPDGLQITEIVFIRPDQQRNILLCPWREPEGGKALKGTPGRSFPFPSADLIGFLSPGSRAGERVGEGWEWYNNKQHFYKEAIPVVR